MRTATPMLAALAVLVAPLAGCASAPSASPPRSSPPAVGTVAGTVLSAPSCPVERLASPCPPRPVVGATVAFRGPTSRTVRTGAGGRFTAHVPAGTYTVTATNTGGLRTTATRTVTVRAGATVSVRLVVDSGIR